MTKVGSLWNSGENLRNAVQFFIAESAYLAPRQLGAQQNYLFLNVNFTVVLRAAF